VRRAEVRAGRHRAVRELVRVQLAEDDGARLLEPFDGLGVVRGEILGEDLRAGGSTRARDVDHVFDGNGNSPKCLSFVDTFERIGSSERRLGPHGDVGIQRVVDPVDSVEVRLHGLTRRKLARPESCGQLGHAHGASSCGSRRSISASAG
jgi:hypothetical protein